MIPCHFLSTCKRPQHAFFVEVWSQTIVSSVKVISMKSVFPAIWSSPAYSATCYRASDNFHMIVPVYYYFICSNIFCQLFIKMIHFATLKWYMLIIWQATWCTLFLLLLLLVKDGSVGHMAVGLSSWVSTILIKVTSVRFFKFYCTFNSDASI